MKFEKLGWIVAAALAGCMFGAGFQDKNEKSGTVDLAKVFNDSDYAKKQTESLKGMGQVRQSVIDFVRSNQHVKVEAADRFRSLSLKDAATAADKADIERIKQDAIASEGAYKTLLTKSGPTDADKVQLEEMNTRKADIQKLLERWSGEFSEELRLKQESLRTDTLTRVREAVQSVAKAQGYSIVFVQDVAPYSANDLTQAALDAMNKKK